MRAPDVDVPISVRTPAPRLHRETLMQTFFKAMFAVLPLALFAQSPAHASDGWKQTCSGPDYVCGGSAVTNKRAAAVSDKPAKAHKIAKAKYKKPVDVGSDDTPVKTKKKVAKSSGGGSSYQSGMASWYGGNFHGRKTANGETYNMNALTAAHKTLPFGTRVRVTNTRNGDTVVVRINDRGPFVGGRVIDLSRAAASQIGLTASGVAPVKITVLGRG